MLIGMRRLIPFPSPMSPERFEAEVRDRARFSHMVALTDHVRNKMAERELTLRQVLNTLRKGTLEKGPDRNDRHATWEGVMTHYGTGRRISVVCALRDREAVVFAVTVY